MTLAISIRKEVVIRRSLLDRARARYRRTGPAEARIDGQSYRCRRGAWATWIPEIGEKYLHAVGGFLHCIHHTAPPRDEVLGTRSGRSVYAPYTLEEWRQAYTTPVTRRAAENAVAAKCLHAAGLGPKVLGLCIALQYRDRQNGDFGYTAGLIAEDATALPPKRPASEEEFLAAGVSLDRLRSALRQQTNGYVVDLNAIVGVTPVNSEDEVKALESQLIAQLEKLGANH